MKQSKIDLLIEDLRVARESVSLSKLVYRQCDKENDRLIALNDRLIALNNKKENKIQLSFESWQLLKGCISDQQKHLENLHWELCRLDPDWKPGCLNPACARLEQAEKELNTVYASQFSEEI